MALLADAWGNFRRWTLSPPFQCATQLSVGVLVAGLWVYVRPMSFHLSCLVAVLYGANLVILAPDNHIGTRLQANATSTGGFAWGAVAAGVVLSLALAAGPPGSGAHTAVLCCLGVAALAVLCGNRATMGPPHPPHVWIAGMVSIISFGVSLIAGQFTSSVLVVWRDVVGCLVAVAALAGATGAGVSVLVLPSLAADEMRADAAAAIRGIGHAAGRFASRALRVQPSAGYTAQPAQPSYAHVDATTAHHNSTTASDTMDKAAASYLSQGFTREADPLAPWPRTIPNGSAAAGELELLATARSAPHHLAGLPPALAAPGPPVLLPRRAPLAQERHPAAALPPMPLLLPPPPTLLHSASMGHLAAPPAPPPLAPILEVGGLLAPAASPSLGSRLAPAPAAVSTGSTAQLQLATPHSPSPDPLHAGARQVAPLLYSSPVPLAVSSTTSSSSNNNRSISSSSSSSLIEPIPAGSASGRPSPAPSASSLDDEGDGETGCDAVVGDGLPRSAAAVAGIAGHGSGGAECREQGHARKQQGSRQDGAETQGGLGGDNIIQDQDHDHRRDQQRSPRHAACLHLPHLHLPHPHLPHLHLPHPHLPHLHLPHPHLPHLPHLHLPHPHLPHLPHLHLSSLPHLHLPHLPSSGHSSPSGYHHHRPHHRSHHQHHYHHRPHAHEDFDPMLEDKDEFLQLLKEATAPHYTPGKGPVEPPPLTAPPGGILPSASARLNSSRSVTRALSSIDSSTKRPSGSGKTVSGKKKKGSDFTAVAAAATARSGRPQGHGTAAGGGGGGDHGGEGRVLGAGPSGGTYGGGGLAGGSVAWAPVAALRPLLVRTRTCLAAAGLEPGWLIRGPKDMGAWAKVISACEVMVSRVAALESLLEDRHQSLCDPRLSELLGSDVISPYREVYGRVAAACAAMAEAVAGCARDRGHRAGSGRVRSCTLVGGWEDARVALRDLLSTAMARYWNRVSAAPTAAGAASHARDPASGCSGNDVACTHNHHYPRSPSVQPLHDTLAHHPQPHPLQHQLQLQPQQAGSSHLAASRESSFGSCGSFALFVAGHYNASCQHCADLAAAASATAAGKAMAGAAASLGTGEQQQLQQALLPWHPGSNGAPGGGATEIDGGGSWHGPLARGGKVPTVNLQQSRSLTYLWTVTEGVLLAMEALEGAVQGALGGGGGGGCGGAGAKAGAGPGNQQQHAEVTRAKGAKDGGAHVGAAGDSRQDKAAPGPEVRLELDAGPAGGGEGEGKQQQQQQHGKQQGKPGWGNGPEEQACGLRGLLSAWASGEAWAWAKPLWPLCLGLPMLRNTPSAAWGTLRALLLPPEPGARRQLLSRRTFQFGLKYWLACCLVLLLLLGLAARSDTGELFRNNPMMFAFIATCVSMTDKVEATLSRALLRAGGTVVGGSLGLAVLAGEGLRHSPVGLQALVCALSFVVGCLISRRVQYGLVLTLLTFLSLAMCPYGGSCCGTTHDTLVLYAVRVLSVLFGCTVPVLLSQLFMPWFASDMALEAMAGTCTATATIVQHLYDQYYKEYVAAHVGTSGREATAAVLRAHGLDEGVLEGLAEGEGEEEGEAQGADKAGEGTGLRQKHQQGQGEGGGMGNGSGQARERRGAGDQALGRDGEQHVRRPALPAAPPPSPPSIQSLVSGPLVSVQASLMKDVAVWTRGLYSVPALVPLALGHQLQLADRLAALQLVVRDTPPVVHGHLSGWVFATLVAPMHKEMTELLDTLGRAASLTAQLLDPRHRAHGGAEPPAHSASFTSSQPPQPHPQHTATSCSPNKQHRHAQPGPAQPTEQQDVETGHGPAVSSAAQGAKRGHGHGQTHHGGQQHGGKGQALSSSSLPHDDLDAELHAAVAASAAAAEGGDTLAALRAALHELDLRRLRLRQHIHAMRHALHAGVRALPPSAAASVAHPDDTVRVNATLFALVGVLDRATATARAVAGQREGERGASTAGGRTGAGARRGGKSGVKE